MSTLAGNKISATYPLLLKIISGGIDGTLRKVEDGDGTDSTLKIASDSIAIDAGDELFLDGGYDTKIRESSSDIMDFYAGGVHMLSLDETNDEVVINEGNGDINFRVESNGDANMLFVDAGNNRVGIGTSSPSELLAVNGDAEINGLTVGKGSGDITGNTAIGSGALSSSTSGSSNTGIGHQALADNTSGTSNTASGRNALSANTTGIGNTAIGHWALNYCTTGDGNVGVGGINSSGSYAPAFSITTEDNRISMGSTSVTNAYVQVAWTVQSDARDKMDIDEVPHGLDFVDDLNSVSFKFKKDRETEVANGGTHYGFLAQDVLALEGNDPVVVNAEDEDKLRMTYEMFIPILANAIQELSAKVEALENNQQGEA